MKKFIAKATEKLGLHKKQAEPNAPEAPQNEFPDDGRIRFNDGLISFNAPEGFFFLSPEGIAQKYSAADRPEVVISNENSTATIACSIRAENISNAPMTEVRHGLSRAFEQSVPQIRWYRNTLLKIDNREWFYAEFSSNQPGAYIYNMVLIAPYGHRMLAFNFNCIMADKEKIKPIYYDCIMSMKVEE